jgi:hypothetical protein
MRRFLLLACLFAAVALVPQARAQIVHDNGTVGDPAWSLSARFIADDFNFATPTSFNTVRFWAGGDDTLPLAYSGTITWHFYDNGASGHPGNLLASGTASPAAQLVVDGAGLDTYLFEFKIPTLTLSGTNFLALHDGPLSDVEADNFLWNAVVGAANPNAEDITVLNSPQPLFSDLAFQLVLVPEPMSCTLLGAGLLAIAARRRRVRQR